MNDDSVRVDERLVVRSRAEGTADLRFDITSFPGVYLTVGDGVTPRFAFPVCGCDACDEDVADLQRMLTELVEAVVGGTFTEFVDGDHVGHVLDGGSGEQMSWQLIPAVTRDERSGPYRRTYAPWPVRSD